MTKKGHTTAILPKCFTSKEATFILRNGDSRSWWFEIQDPLHSFFTIDHLPENHPPLEVNFGHKCKEDRYERIKEMYENEGWEFLDGEDEFTEWLMEKKGCSCIGGKCSTGGNYPCLCECHNKASFTGRGKRI